MVTNENMTDSRLISLYEMFALKENVVFLHVIFNQNIFLKVQLILVRLLLYGQTDGHDIPIPAVKVADVICSCNNKLLIMMLT